MTCFSKEKIYIMNIPNEKYNLKDSELMVSFLMSISKKQLHNG